MTQQELITDTSELFDYLTKIVDCRLSDDIIKLVKAASLEPDRRLHFDAMLATLATSLSMVLTDVPGADDDVIGKIKGLSSFMTIQVSAHRRMRRAMSEVGNAEVGDATTH